MELRIVTGPPPAVQAIGHDDDEQECVTVKPKADEEQKKKGPRASKSGRR